MIELICWWNRWELKRSEFFCRTSWVTQDRPINLPKALSTTLWLCLPYQQQKMPHLFECCAAVRLKSFTEVSWHPAPPGVELLSLVYRTSTEQHNAASASLWFTSTIDNHIYTLDLPSVVRLLALAIRDKTPWKGIVFPRHSMAYLSWACWLLLTGICNLLTCSTKPIVI